MNFSALPAPLQQAGFFALRLLELDLLGHAPLVFQQLDDPPVGLRGLFILAADLQDIGDRRQLVGKARAARLGLEAALVKGDGAVARGAP